MSVTTELATIDAVRDFNRFYTNFLGVLNKAYLDSSYTLTDARVLLNPAVGTAGPEAFILRTGAAGNVGHFEPLWPRG